MMDAENPVVKLCAAGMAAEGEGRGVEAKALFDEAWEHQPRRLRSLHRGALCRPASGDAGGDVRHGTNARCTAREAVGDDRVRDFLPSLYLNYAHSLEQLGRTHEACSYYALAAARLDDLPPGGYAQLVRGGVTAGQRRTCGGHID